ncbi:hypothetical protein ABZ649_04570 [Streptomyces albidoflavus]
MQNVAIEITAPETATLVTEQVDEITLGRQNFNDSDKSNYFEGSKY